MADLDAIEERYALAASFAPPTTKRDAIRAAVAARASAADVPAPVATIRDLTEAIERVRKCNGVSATPALAAAWTYVIDALPVARIAEGAK